MNASFIRTPAPRMACGTGRCPAPVAVQIATARPNRGPASPECPERLAAAGLDELAWARSAWSTSAFGPQIASATAGTPAASIKGTPDRPGESSCRTPAGRAVIVGRSC